MVPLFRRRLDIAGLSGHTSVTSARDRRRLLRGLERDLQALTARSQRDGVKTVEVQLVLQVVTPPGYAEWKRQIERAWRRQGGRYTTASWPESLGAPDAYAVVLIPIRAGRVGLAAGRNPELVADPLFSYGSPPKGTGYEDLVLSLVCRWVANPADGYSARLAPPVVETVQGGHVDERRVMDFGQSWHLPVADGL